MGSHVSYKFATALQDASIGDHLFLHRAVYIKSGPDEWTYLSGTQQQGMITETEVLIALQEDFNPVWVVM